MRLCITEKPSVGRDIARILGANEAHQGYMCGGDWCVTWTFGHLCELKEPHEYTPFWKAWALSRLPMVPPRFGIRLKDDDGVRRQMQTITTLAARADEVINCGDAGQEGELIQRWVMQHAGVKVPVRRLWISSLTDEAIREGFAHLKPSSDYDRLYHAGLCRAIGDWLLGINATRLFTLRYSRPGRVLSLGRVQTPTLALIVERDRQIASFKPSDSWQLQTLYRGARFTATTAPHATEAAAQTVLDRIKGQPFTVTDVTEKKGREAPPRLFDLTSLQVECNKQWGWTADVTLRLIQSLYEKKVTTYPRVDTTYLPDDLYAKVPDILRRMTPYAPLTAPVLAKKLPKSKKVFDSSKVTDHHAIIPTGESPAGLVGDERHLYHLIARRFIAAFYPDCLFATTTVIGNAQCSMLNAQLADASLGSDGSDGSDGSEARAATSEMSESSETSETSESSESGAVAFKATGKVITSPGWRAVYAGDKADKTDTDAEQPPMPPMTVGESGPHSPSLVKKTTTPPRHYTDATLLRAMEAAGRDIDDDDTLRDALKANGIGRPSTRAAIIDTLFSRQYLRRQGRSILATQAGMSLIDLVHDPLLKSARLTGMWEHRLRLIEAGDYDPAAFLAEMKEMVGALVASTMAEPPAAIHNS